MRYLFIINPAAGKVNAFDLYEEKIRKVCDSKELDYEIVVTEYNGHATQIASAAADEASADYPLRVFSVGGDGTFCEVANGLIGKQFCECGCIPCGSGNDFVKTFGEIEEFLDFDSYFDSESVPVDAIRAGDMYSINICSLGLDAMICDRANRLKTRKKKLSSSKAYDKAVVRSLFGRLYNKLTITIDDRETFRGKFLFSLAASGQYYGGGYHSAPMAVPSDGLLDFILIKTVSHLKVPFLIKDYKSGEYVHKRRFRKIYTHRRGTKMHIESRRPVILNVDGECTSLRKVTLEILPGALRFVVPRSYAELLDLEALSKMGALA
ncbi:MAG: diacylglycerol kinase family lipid kinase [Clostridia bacterium]|nr:diacylglycerol kinase family lipid kinase [Clostridia bacterium]